MAGIAASVSCSSCFVLSPDQIERFTPAMISSLYIPPSLSLSFLHLSLLPLVVVFLEGHASSSCHIRSHLLNSIILCRHLVYCFPVAAMQRCLWWAVGVSVDELKKTLLYNVPFAGLAQFLLQDVTQLTYTSAAESLAWLPSSLSGSSDEWGVAGQTADGCSAQTDSAHQTDINNVSRPSQTSLQVNCCCLLRCLDSWLKLSKFTDKWTFGPCQ